ncbi:serine/threonine-protein kinase Nek11 isoform X1 [Mus musculus]|uniref:Serine/threonine-protein kinase Nek11 n=5 Tax=Mus musculus TaxID=10090 RepID=NEK11_MOUSE|nr:serine/threonine-protein kinase Nek11 [Mus musculus]XP_006511742.1 serine/threonine-protein kinase Nek11 isoform X1 [Mus musculus]Q8C0Q4.2 RecName: Full=Serine/threonine-protein kinase Nek11; AltName: Full=Never in mitosis A-related kinase 11; Short=NimA-related protein kinase 11 [Mus musculus]|eukprot:NP_766049.2 serine/threonine-protein kinase Nek11 [Mus musculus]
MLKFQETAKCVGRRPTVIPMYPTALIARRYVLQQKLGSGSFGTVYLVSDKKAKPGEELKVLKEISVGELNPNETVQANVEAQLLSRLHHPAIVRFHASFMEQETFCIITEYCEGRDLDYRIQEYKEAGKVFAENQIVEWFIQLLLGVDYMHERRILHRDLKSKNIFLKNNLLKIGDFGVSRLLMGSCELATTLTGTPHYMSPEALKHQGYDAKSDIWSLACILYEMCCLDHAFAGSSFLSVVLNIVEGKTPSLPDRYPRELNTIMERMLNKSPSLRPSAADILKAPYMEEQLQLLMCKYPEMTLEDKNSVCQKEAAHTINAVQKKLHLQTLQALSDTQKTTPRERMWLRKLQAADERARRLKKIAEENYKENDKRMQALRSRNVGSVHAHVLHELDERTLESLPEPQSLPCLDLDELEPSLEDTIVDLGHYEIPEDPLVAEQYYSDVFDSCSEDSEEQEEEMIFSEAGGDTKEEESPSVYRTNQQDSDTAALVGCLEHVLGYTSLDTKTITNAVTDMSPGPMVFNSAVARTKMKRMKESAVQKLGMETFEEVYDYLKRARHQNAREAEIWEHLETVVPRASDCFEVDQLLYFEELLLTMEGKEPSLQNLPCEAAQKKPVKGTHFCDNP